MGCGENQNKLKYLTNLNFTYKKYAQRQIGFLIWTLT